MYIYMYIIYIYIYICVYICIYIIYVYICIYYIFPIWEGFIFCQNFLNKLYNAPGRPVISNYSYHTKNISSFQDYHLQPIVQAVKSCIRDTNDLLKKLCSLSILSDGIIMCTSKYTIQGSSFSTSRKIGESESEFGEKIIRQKRRTAVRWTFAPPYSVLLMAELEEKN